MGNLQIDQHSCSLTEGLHSQWVLLKFPVHYGQEIGSQIWLMNRVYNSGRVHYDLHVQLSMLSKVQK